MFNKYPVISDRYPLVTTYWILFIIHKMYSGKELSQVQQNYGVAAMALRKGLTMSGGHRFCTDRSGNGNQGKRTEDDVRFAQSFEKLVAGFKDIHTCKI